MYTLIGSPKTRGFRVLWMLEELGADYDIVPANPRSDEIRAVNPNGKVPALRVDEQIIHDSSAICQYLADAHGILTHTPGTLGRGRQDALLHQVLDEFDAILWTAARHSFILPKDRRVPAVKDALKWEFNTSVRNIETHIGDGSWLMGEMFTVPDVILTHCCGWAHNAGFDLGSGVLKDYTERARARPAYYRAHEIRSKT